jgi:hypothetical protein
VGEIPLEGCHSGSLKKEGTQRARRTQGFLGLGSSCPHGLGNLSGKAELSELHGHALCSCLLQVPVSHQVPGSQQAPPLWWTPGAPPLGFVSSSSSFVPLAFEGAGPGRQILSWDL